MLPPFFNYHFYYTTKKQKPQSLLRKLRYIFEPCSMRAAKPAALALRALLRCAQRSRSNHRSLADKRACRLGFARLSAPPALRFKSFFLFRKKEKNPSLETWIFWRRRKDLNLRAGYPTYTLSRGASSPLEYFSIKTSR